jgi:hypothetical protein
MQRLRRPATPPSTPLLDLHRSAHQTTPLVSTASPVGVYPHRSLPRQISSLPWPSSYSRRSAPQHLCRSAIRVAPILVELTRARRFKWSYLRKSAANNVEPRRASFLRRPMRMTWPESRHRKKLSRASTCSSPVPIAASDNSRSRHDLTRKAIRPSDWSKPLSRVSAPANQQPSLDAIIGSLGICSTQPVARQFSAPTSRLRTCRASVTRPKRQFAGEPPAAARAIPLQSLGRAELELLASRQKRSQWRGSWPILPVLRRCGRSAVA